MIDLPPLKWTGLVDFSLHFDRADISDGGVETGSIVEALDEGEDVALGVGAGRVVVMMDELGFQTVEEALHRGIVVAIGFAAHRCDHAGELESVTIAV